MELTNDSLDLIDKEFDLALRIGKLNDPGLVARRLISFRTQVYANPMYIAQHGEPRHPDELLHHRTFAMSTYHRNGGNDYVWRLSQGEHKADFRIDPVLVTNDPAALRGALLSGEGLMLGADVMVKLDVAQGRVVRVLAGWEGPTLDMSAVFPRGQGKSPKVRAFVDFLVERLSVDADYMEAMCSHGKCHESEALVTADAA
ncbi:MAG: substrate binding domain-containing protein [Steroidobacteraceae bacterium]|jgi:DNA-binding transcriptional LysR family regulator|nr:substrate binding domain-containing protein [Steroidobacteraceae bacterium]